MEYYCVKEADIAMLKEAVKNLEGWQETQNGALVRLADQLADANEILDSKINELQSWLRKILFTTIITLASLLINIIVMEVFR